MDAIRPGGISTAYLHASILVYIEYMQYMGYLVIPFILCIPGSWGIMQVSC